MTDDVVEEFVLVMLAGLREGPMRWAQSQMGCFSPPLDEKVSRGEPRRVPSTLPAET